MKLRQIFGLLAGIPGDPVILIKDAEGDENPINGIEVRYIMDGDLLSDTVIVIS